MITICNRCKALYFTDNPNTLKDVMATTNPIADFDGNPNNPRWRCEVCGSTLTTAEVASNIPANVQGRVHA